MQRITFTNAAGQSITLTNARPYLLTSITGTGAADTDVQMQKAPYQDGQTYIDTLLEPRTIYMEVAILTGNREELFQRRREMVQVFNPKLGPGVLRYEYDGGAKEIEATVELAPVFPAGKENRGSGFQRALITLICPNPFWRDVAKTKAEIAIWRGALEFPLELVEEGLEVGFREPSLIVNIYNPGDVPCGMEIRFKALATVVNPLLFNVNTREELKINKTMTAGEAIIVTTHFGNKRVESWLNGVSTNAFNWLDLSSTFLQLDPGDNLLRYDAEEGLDNLEVDIYYTPQYLGV